MSGLLPTSAKLAMTSSAKVVYMGDLVRIEHGFAFAGEFFSGEPPGDILVTPGNFAIGGGFQKGKRRYYRGPVPDAYVLTPGDLLVTMTDLSRASDTLGYPALVPDPGSDSRFLHNQRIGKVIIQPSAPVDKRFLYYVMCTKAYRHEILAGATGTTVRHTSPSRIYDYRFLLPELHEQRAISSVLGAMDDKIALIHRLSETLGNWVAALFESWFSEISLSNWAIAGLDGGAGQGRQSDLSAGGPRHGWRVGSLGELAVRVIEKVDTPAEWADERLIDLGRIPERSIALTDWGRGAELATSVTRFRKGDTLFGAIRPYFHKVGVAPFDGVTNVSVFVIRATRPSDGPFVTALCSTSGVVAYATRVARGTKMPVVASRDLDRYELMIPPPDLRARFGRAAGPMLDRVISNVTEARLLAQLRDLLVGELIPSELPTEARGTPEAALV